MVYQFDHLSLSAFGSWLNQTVFWMVSEDNKPNLFNIILFFPTYVIIQVICHHMKNT